MSAEATWAPRRWAEVCGAVAVAPRDWQRWAQGELTADPVGAHLLTAHGWQGAGDTESGAYDAQRSPQARTAAGQFFTPPDLADALVRLVPDALAPCTVLDPACGAGELLCAVFRARRSQGLSTAAALKGLTGWDLDPVAAWGARANLIVCALEAPSGPVPGRLGIHGDIDALSQEACADVVVMNPPYLEAKRMRGAQPGLRERLKEEFPELCGAFDLYMAFLLCTPRWLTATGCVAALLPNKVCQSRYGVAIRQHSQLSLSALDDLSRLSPRPFPGTSVYPVLLALTRVAAPSVRVRHVHEYRDLEHAPHHSVARSVFAAFHETPWFVPWETWATLEPAVTGPRLDTLATVRSTCSFHKRGLREQYVVPDEPKEPAHRYVGGPSYTRTSEVGPYSLQWAGWWLRDAARTLGDHGNPLPSLDEVFLRPKLILRQHARRVEAVVDADGRYVTKDVYPVAWPHQSEDLHTLAAILNSTVFTALYNSVFQGIVVGGETYHYLPLFLRQIPVPHSERLDEVRALAPHGREQWLAIDRAVASAYGISEADRQRLVEVHLRRVGAAVPGECE